jgi:drug/metabolite transporter (DMT)-like permease
VSARDGVSDLRVRLWTTIALTVLFNSGGNLFLSLGMKRVGELHSWSLAGLVAFGGRTAANGSVWIGLLLLALFLVSYLLLLSWADYSYVHPASAVGYAVVPLLGYAAAGEQVSALRWAGIVLICVGVALVGHTPARTTS